jgi:purine-nucleoside phosphorylase
MMNESMTSMHMGARFGEFAESVLMPGDPLRAKYVADNFLTDARQITDVRNMLGFTGRYKDNPVSVMAHGMGGPSAAIYATELIRDYKVRNIIRIGSCGTVLADLKLRDIIVAQGCSTDSSVNRIRFGGYDFAALADFELLNHLVECIANTDAKAHVGNVFSSDLFYAPDNALFDLMKKYRVLAVEMELSAIYTIAAELGARAVGMCTVSDQLSTGESLSTDDRQSSFDQMIGVALDAAVSFKG